MVDIWPVQNILDVQALVQKYEILHISAIAILIPNLDNVKSLLRTNTNADDAILNWSPTNHVQRAGCDIALIELIGEILADLDTVGATADIHMVFPQRRVRVAHKELHAIIKLVYAN